jgi:hypothetical protein
MTFPEVLEIGKACLVNYESRLEVRGKRPYNGSYARKITRLREVSLLSATKETIEAIIGEVLDEMVELKDGFQMSGPPETLPIAGCKKSAEVCQNDLSLSFYYQYNVLDDTSHLRVSCWWYPVG